MHIECAHDEVVDLEALVPNPKNPNQHPDKQIKLLAKIMKHQGWRSPIVVSNRSGFITKGHGRLMAAKVNKWGKAPVDRQDYATEADEYADMVADNKIAELAETDMQSVFDGVKDLPDFDYDLLGIPDFTLPETLEPQCDEDEVPEVVEPKTKLGDIYTLGNHRLMCGDSTSIDAVEKLMMGEKADMVFTDPTYNQETGGGSSTKIGYALRKQSKEIEHMCDFDPTDFLNILPTVFDECLNAYVFCNKDLVVDYLKWSRENKYAYNILIWKKPSAIPIGGSYRPDIEYLLVFRKFGIFNGAIPNVNYSKVLEHKRELNKVHPTMKPVEMIENQIYIASNSNSNILDLFGGSGSTLIACEKTSRKCFMMELDPHYCDVIIARWEKYTGKKANLCP